MTGERAGRGGTSRAAAAAGSRRAGAGNGSRDARDPKALDGSLRRLQRENSTLRLVIAIHDRLGALILQGAEPSAITAALSELIDRPVLLLDGFLRPLSFEPGAAELISAPQPPAWQPDDAYVARVLRSTAEDRRPLRLPPLPALGVSQGCVLAPVTVGDDTLGYLAILEAADEDDASTSAEAELLAAQHAASVCALALMRQRLAAEVTTELRDELLEGLLLGQVIDDQAARERARRLGYDEALQYRALVLIADAATREPGSGPSDPDWAAGWRRRMLDAIGQLVRERAPRAIASRRRGELVVLLPEDAALAPADLGRTVKLYVSSLYPERQVTIGIGGACAAPRDIARSYAQARRAAEVAQRFGRRGEVASFEDLGLYRLLFQISDRNELRAFVDQVLGELIEYDRKHRTDFVHTLRTYLAKDNSLQATARELYVHVNTAAYRIQRIQLISGLDLGRTEDCVLARAALMILEDEAV